MHICDLPSFIHRVNRQLFFHNCILNLIKKIK
jgi:hypothetical protein